MKQEIKQRPPPVKLISNPHAPLIRTSRHPEIFSLAEKIVDCELVNERPRTINIFGWWLMLICSDIKILLTVCWWLVCFERKLQMARV
jgi:hypothetical protein